MAGAIGGGIAGAIVLLCCCYCYIGGKKQAKIKAAEKAKREADEEKQATAERLNLEMKKLKDKADAKQWFAKGARWFPGGSDLGGCVDDDGRVTEGCFPGYSWMSIRMAGEAHMDRVPDVGGGPLAHQEGYYSAAAVRDGLAAYQEMKDKEAKEKKARAKEAKELNEAMAATRAKQAKAAAAKKETERHQRAVDDARARADEEGARKAEARRALAEAALAHAAAAANSAQTKGHAMIDMLAQGATRFGGSGDEAPARRRSGLRREELTAVKSRYPKASAVEEVTELLVGTIVDLALVAEKLPAAMAFCDKDGVASLADITKFELADGFISALEPLRSIPRAKLKAKLQPLTPGELLNISSFGRDRSSIKGVPAPTTTTKRAGDKDMTAGDVLTVRGTAYTLKECLNLGNADIWEVTDDHGSTRVLKIAEKDSVLEEVAARQALGWDYHARFMLRAYDHQISGGTGMLILEKAARTLRHRIDASGIDRTVVPQYLKGIVSGLKELHNQRLVHMDIKPANIFQVVDMHTGDAIWKLGDFDCSRRFGEAAGGFTANYAAPELAAAELNNEEIVASDKMDIWSAGLAVLECVTGVPLIAKGTDKLEALGFLSTLHGAGGAGGATTALEERLSNAMRPLDASMRSALEAMLEINPAVRKSAGGVLMSGLISGQVTTTVRRAANKEVLSAMSTMKQEIIAEISGAEERLAEQIEAGNSALLSQMRQMQAESLPSLIAAVKQAQLELTIAIDDGGNAEAAAEASAKVEAALSAVRNALPPGCDDALSEMFSDLDGHKPRGSPAKVNAQLESLLTKLTAMDESMHEIGQKVDSAVAERDAHFELLTTKLDQLLLKENEQVFKYFIMKPLPEKSRTGKVLGLMKPKNWLTHPMLLVPMYKNASGCLLEAPVANKYKGYKVSKPNDFVKKHPRMVQIGMLALKIGIKIAATQLAVNIPAATLDAIGPNTDGLINELLTKGCEAMQDTLDDDDKMERYNEKMNRALNSTFGAPSDAPDDAMDELLSDAKFKTMSQREYSSFKDWMDGAHAGWIRSCGLVSEINPETGKAEWVPPGVYSK